MDKENYTEEEVLAIIEEAFWDGYLQGDEPEQEVEERFDATFYLIEK